MLKKEFKNIFFVISIDGDIDHFIHAFENYSYSPIWLFPNLEIRTPQNGYFYMLTNFLLK